MNTAVVITVTVAKLTVYGFCLGIGFWGAKKLTNLADEYLILWSESKQNQIAREIEQELGIAASIKV